jgi:hypothetical protein
MSKNRFQSSRGRRFYVWGALVLAGACGNTKPASKDGNGAGGESGWTYLPPGSGTAGSGTGGASNGGSAQAGTAGVGGAVLPTVTFTCDGKKPDQPLITSFNAFMADAWRSPGNLDGGVYVYPETLTPSAGDFLRLEADVTTYTGVGVWFSGCIDASRYSGVRFTISGDAGPSGSVRFFPVINRNRDVAEEFSVGSCVPDNASDPWPSCHPPEVNLPVTSQPTVHSVPWSAFTGGVPTATTDGSDLLTFEWAFRWQPADGPFTGKVTIDDVAFYTDDNQGGAGGAGAGGGAGEQAGESGSAGLGGNR